MERNRAIFVLKSKYQIYIYATCIISNWKKEAKIFEKSLAKTGFLCYDTYRQLYGGIAQLGERLNGIQEVSGSIPLISTTTKRTENVRFSVLFCI